MPIGVDIGATTTRVAAVQCGRAMGIIRRPTAEVAGSQDPAAFIDALANAIREVRGGGAMSTTASCGASDERIGLAFAGLVDRRAGKVLRSVRLPFLEGFPLADAIARAVGSAVRLMTDADAATWGEYAACTPRPARFCHLRLGTGIACGLVINETLCGIDEPRSTHAPSLIADPSADAAACPCGLAGCLELFASGAALGEAAAEFDLPSVPALRTAWLAGRAEVRAMIAELVQRLHYVAASLRRRFALDCIVLGGGVIESWPELADMMKATAGGPSPMIRARLGEEAGVIGAATLAEFPA